MTRILAKRTAATLMLQASILAAVTGEEHLGNYSYVFAIPHIDTADKLDSNLFISITNPGETKAQVCVFLPETNDMHWNIPPGVTGVVKDDKLPSHVQLGSDNSEANGNPPVGSYHKKRIIITANESVSIVAGSTSGDAFFILPVSSLGTRYYVVTGKGSCASGTKQKTQVVVVNGGDYKRNEVTVIIAGAAKPVIKILLTPEDRNTWAYESHTDITGTFIESEYPVAVIAGRQRIQGENGFEAEMLPPVTSWSRDFVIPYQESDQKIKVFRLLAAFEETDFRFEGEASSNRLSAGQYADLLVDQPRLLKSTKSTLLVQLPDYSSDCFSSNRGSENGFEEGASEAAYRQMKNESTKLDPLQSAGFFTLIPPVQQYDIDQVCLSNQPYATKSDFRHYRVLLHPKSENGEPPMCSSSSGKLSPVGYSTVNGFDVKTYQLDKTTVINCAGSLFAVISYGRGPEGSLGYAFAYSQWKSIGDVGPTTTQRHSGRSSNTSTSPVPSTAASADEFTSDLTRKLVEIEKMSNLVNDSESAEQLLTGLANALHGTKAMNDHEIQLVVTSLERCARIQGLNNASLHAFIECVDIILDQDDIALARSNTSGQILRSLQNTTANTNTVDLMKDGKNLAVVITMLSCTNGKGVLQSKNGSLATLDGWPNKTRVNDAVAFIFLPPMANCDHGRTKREAPETLLKAGPADTRAAFTMYRNHKLFRTANAASEKKSEASCSINHWPQSDLVISADIPVAFQADKISRPLKNPVSIVFYVDNGSKPLLHARSVCTFWDSGQWASDGCRLVESKHSIHHCQCDHLTDFTLLVDVSTADPFLCDECISAFTLALTFISIVALCSALLLYFVPKHMKYCFPDTTTIRPEFLKTLLRTPLPRANKSSLSEPLMASILAFLALFTLLSDRTYLGLTATGCRVAAAVLYSMLLVQLCWAALAGLNFFKNYYVVFEEDTLRTLTKRAMGLLVCIVIPALTTVILWTTRDDFFDREDDFCWVRPDYVGLAVILPLSILIAADVILTVFLAKNFFCVTAAAPKRKWNTRLVAQKCTVLVTVQVILAFPWIFQFFTIGSPEITVFHYVFSFMYGSQGAVLSLLYIFAYIRWLQRHRTADKGSVRTATTQDASKLSQGLQKIMPLSLKSIVCRLRKEN